MISRDELKEMLRYDTNHEHFVCLYNINKTLRKGSVVRGSRPNDHGPLTVSLNGTTYPLHRLVWLWYRGEFNKKPLYHINGDKTDNRYSNLTLMQKGTRLEYNQDTGYVSGVQQKTEQRTWQQTTSTDSAADKDRIPSTSEPSPAPLNS